VTQTPAERAAAFEDILRPGVPELCPRHMAAIEP
jgi:hypothetical protein